MLEWVLDPSAWVALATLTLLEIVLGIDNVIFVSIILGRIPAEKRLLARRIWMVGGILLRSGLLIGLGWLVKNGENELVRIAGYPFNLRNMIMFFGGLFTTYAVYKYSYPQAFYEASHHLDIRLGAFNTVVLIASSLTMALGVQAAQLGQRHGRGSLAVVVEKARALLAGGPA